MLRDLFTTLMTQRLMIMIIISYFLSLVVQELDYVDLAVLHYVSQTRTDTLNAEITYEASHSIKICDVCHCPFKGKDV